MKEPLENQKVKYFSIRMPLIAWAQIFVEAGHKACGCTTQNGRNFNLLSMFHL